jgi:D-threo-aldose 1-dehydrogenase
VISISLNTSRPERVKENVSLVESEIPDEFWKEMKRRGLIDNEYPYL